MKTETKQPHDKIVDIDLNTGRALHDSVTRETHDYITKKAKSEMLEAIEKVIRTIKNKPTASPASQEWTQRMAYWLEGKNQTINAIQKEITEMREELEK